MRISVIIPTLNENAFLEKTISHVRKTTSPRDVEIIVVDAGSQDGTVALAQKLADKTLHSKQRGRAVQLHQGALAATGDMLLFLHADCQLPDEWFVKIESSYASKVAPVATAFRKSFDKKSTLFKFIAWGSAVRSHLTGVAHGDQALTVSRERYFQVGGFPPVELMEEYYLGRKLQRYGNIHFLPDEVIVSTRRYDKSGPLFHSFRNAFIVLLHYLGFSSQFLKRIYSGSSARIPVQLLVALSLLGSPVAAFDPFHAAFDQVLRKHNKQGLVQYQALKSDPADLNSYLKSLSAVSSAEFEKWNDREKIAFWINAYNAFTLKAVIVGYPVTSIRDINKVWEKKIYSVMGRKLSLDDIEHEIIRKKFNEPRIHMALVCAALGCPRLSEEAFTGASLDQQLKNQTLLFLADPNNFRIDRKSSKVYLSSIFDWFGNDFVRNFTPAAGFLKQQPKEKAALNFIGSHLGPDDQAYLQSSQYEVKYLPYDWSLNEKKP